jgi:hypothetical protein
MVRVASVGIGLGLLALAVIAFFTGAAPWLAAADVVGALCAFAVALVVHGGERGKLAVGMPSVMSLSLLIVTLCAAGSRATAWLTVMTFLAAVAFAIVAWRAMPRAAQRVTPSSRRI